MDMCHVNKFDRERLIENGVSLFLYFLKKGELDAQISYGIFFSFTTLHDREKENAQAMTKEAKKVSEEDIYKEEDIYDYISHDDNEHEEPIYDEVPEFNLHAAKWYHGNASRKNVESILKSDGRVGCYLIRDSTNYVGDYTLCLLSINSRVEHYRIIVKDEGPKKLTVDEEVYFATLEEFVGYYSQSADGLCTALKYPVSK